MQCANCHRAAIYIYAPRQISPSAYCERHLPSFLKTQARTGLLETTPAFDDARAAALSKLATPQPEPEAAPEPANVTEEQTDVEPVVEEKPKRKRRAPRKKAEPAAEESAEA